MEGAVEETGVLLPPPQDGEEAVGRVLVAAIVLEVEGGGILEVLVAHGQAGVAIVGLVVAVGGGPRTSTAATEHIRLRLHHSRQLIPMVVQQSRTLLVARDSTAPLLPGQATN